MTATLRGEKHGARTATRDAAGTRTYTRVFVVETTDAQDGADIVLSAVGLPQHGEPYSTANENDYASLVSDRAPEQLPGINRAWEVTITYSTTSDTDENNEDEEPLTRPVDVTWSTETYRVIVPFGVTPGAAEYAVDDADKVGIVNSAGEPFDPPPMMDESRQILTVTRNEQTIDAVQIGELQNATNAGQWLGAAERVVRIKGIVATKQTDNRDPNNKYWRVTYTFSFNDKTWDLQILDHGTYYLDSTNGFKETAFLTEEGQPRLGLLTALGGVADVDNPHYVRLEIYPTADFAELDLEQAILDQLENKVIR